MRKNILLTPLMVILAAVGAHAQDVSTAVMAGRVTSQDGAPLRGVRVIIESSALLGSRQAVTDANGQFRTPLLPGGEYSVTYTLDGYITRKVTTRLVPGQVGNVSTRLTSISAQETTVEIFGSQAQVDKTDTVVQTSLTTEFMTPLMNVDDWNAMGALIPGLFDLGTGGGGILKGEISIRGGTYRSTKMLVNGLNNSDMYGGYAHWGTTMPLTDLIESVAIMQSPLNARHGNSDGGLMSVVTSKGSNEFKGTFRVRLSNDLWRTRDAGYPYRGDPTEFTATAGNGNLGKSYEVTLQGPLWKDHLTFAYGAVLNPTSYNSAVRWGPWSNPAPRPENNVGVYFQDPKTGDIVRRSELYSLTYPNSPSSMWYQQDYTERNQFTILAQITPQHQLEYNYAQTFENTLNPNWGRPVDMYPDNIQYFMKRYWTMAYKGIVGNSGVLDVSYGKTLSDEQEGKVGGKPIMPFRIPSYVPIDGNYYNYDPSNYWVNGYIDNQINPNRGSVDGWWTEYNGGDISSAGGNDLFSINYQHILSTQMGTHIFDVGMSNNKSWRRPNAGSGTGVTPYSFYITGHIAVDLGANPWDVYNPTNPNAIANASNYADKYIVFNVPVATARDIDPVGTAYWAANRPDLLARPDDLLINTGYARNIYPRMSKRFGPESGEFFVNMRSFYLNDMWSINDNHSVMLGIRLDNFTLGDATVSSVHTYMKPTFRSEYKWDILGDQSRLLNVSLAQFHNQNQISAFQAVTNSQRLPDSKDYYWTGAAVANARTDGKPYLVEREDILNENNYTYEYNASYGGQRGARLDPDWKSPTSTEFAIGYTRNLKNGGVWKITFVRRTWSDLYDIFPDGPGTETNIIDGRKSFVRVLKNSDEFEKSYTGLEVEWNYPLTRRFTFGGNYTYGRLMYNLSAYGSGESEARSVSNWNTHVNWYEFWDKFWDRDEWAPVYNRQPEHVAGFYLTYDLSAGKAKSSIALRGTYTSGRTTYDSFDWYTGYPTSKEFSWLSGMIDYNYDYNAAFGGLNSIGQSIPFNWRVTDDTWGLSLRYHFEMPLMRKLVWFTTMDMSNPFNHRGINNWFGPYGPDEGDNFMVDLLGPGGRLLYSKNDFYKGVWRSSDDARGQYRTYQGGRSFSMQTGLRF
jgi:hypothetical protein